MLGQIFGCVVMLCILSVLIIVHECGHFLVARMFGFQTPVFGIGLPFGPYKAIGRKWDTEFRLYAFLMGGFVAIPELGDESNQEAFGQLLKPFHKFPIWQRALVALAGVAFNIIFAWLIMFSMFAVMGLPTQKTFVVDFPPSPTIAANAGIHKNDIITAIDATEITSSDDAVGYLGRHKSSPVQITVDRAGKSVTLSMTTNDHGKVGMILGSKGPVVYKKLDGNIVSLAGLATERLWGLARMMVETLGDMLGAMFSGGKTKVAGQAVGVGDLHGVLAVIKIGADIAQHDFSQLLIFTIYISLDLAILNLLPWPALDGGHLAFMAFEAVRGRPMGERAQGEIVKWGFISLIVLMMVIMVNDVTALVSGKLDFKSKDKENSSSTSTATTETKPDGTNTSTAKTKSESTTTSTSDAKTEGASSSSSDTKGASAPSNKQAKSSVSDEKNSPVPTTTTAATPK